MFELPDKQETSAIIKVIGIGGGGSNALEHMLEGNVRGVEFVCANTDLQALRKSKAKVLLQLGEGLTRGLGAGANPEVGRQAAEENRDLIRDLLSGSDMVFLTAGMGGGTGTGAAPVFAEIAKELGVLTVAVVTKPFSFEGPKRARLAQEGIAKLASHVDSLITIPNDRLLPVLGKDISLITAFNAANDVLLGAVQGISELITRPGLINVDFADVRTVMSEMGMAMMGTACASGENRARLAAEAAIASPLLDDVDLKGARGVLVNITAGSNISIGEFEDVGSIIRDFAADEATVVVGTVIDDDMSNELRVTVVVTGISQVASMDRNAPRPTLTMVGASESRDSNSGGNGASVEVSSSDDLASDAASGSSERDIAGEQSAQNNNSAENARSISHKQRQHTYDSNNNLKNDRPDNQSSNPGNPRLRHHFGTGDICSEEALEYLDIPTFLRTGGVAVSRRKNQK